MQSTLLAREVFGNPVEGCSFLGKILQDDLLAKVERQTLYTYLSPFHQMAISLSQSTGTRHKL